MKKHFHAIASSAAALTQSAFNTLISLIKPRALALYAGAFMTGTVLADGPDGYEGSLDIISGDVVITFDGIDTWTINQFDNPNVFVRYSSFDVDAGTIINFLQNQNDYRILNRIDGGAPTTLAGQINSNGIVMFVNPAGIVFSDSAVLDVGGLYAAAGTITRSQFLTGAAMDTPEFQFSDLDGEVINNSLALGSAGQTRMVHLLGQRVVNNGNINLADGGLVTMISADTVTIREAAGIGDPSIFVQIKDPGAALPGADPGVHNNGDINAGVGGQVFLGAGDIYALAISNDGNINADQGRVDMNAASGDIHSAGSIDTGSGGLTNILAQHGNIDVSGNIETTDGEINIDAPDGNVHFSGVIDTPGTAVTMTGKAANGIVTHEGVLNADTFAVDAGLIRIGADINTTDRSDFFGFTRITAPVVLINAGNDAHFHGSLVGGGFDTDLTVLADNSITVDNKTRKFGELSFGDSNNSVQALNLLGNLTQTDQLDAFANESTISGFIVVANQAFFDGNITLDRNGTQVLRGVDVLNIEGDITKTGASALQIHGKDIRLAGTDIQNLNGGGNAYLQIGSVNVDSTITFDGIGDQNVTAGTHLLMGGALAQKTTAGDLNLDSSNGTFAFLDINVTQGNLNALDKTNVKGNVDARDQVHFHQEATVEGNVTSLTNDVTIDGHAIVDGNILADQNVDLNDSSNITGDVTATNGTAMFQGAAVVDGNVQADGDVHFHATSVVDGDITSTTGNATFEGPSRLGGNVTADNDITFNSDAELNGAGDQALTAGHNVQSADGANIAKTTSGNLDVNATNRARLGGDLTTNDGDLNINTNVLLDGSGSSQKIDARNGTLTIDGTLKTDDNDDTDVILGGDSGVILNDQVNIKRGGLTVTDDLTVNGGSITTRDGQQYEQAVALGDDTIFTSGEEGDIIFDGTVDGSHKLTVNTGGDTIFNDDIGATDRLISIETDEAGTTQLGGDLNVSGGATINDNLMLLDDIRIDDSGTVGVIFGKDVDGPFALVVSTLGNADFGGNIGAADMLDSFETAVSGTTIFRGELLQALNDVRLNTSLGGGDVPLLATIGATGDFKIVAANGDVIFGDQQKLTGLGDIDIEAADGTVRIGDVNAIGDLRITASVIEILSRAGALVRNADGTFTKDLGADLVIGGDFFFSVTPVTIGDGLVQFASFGGEGDKLDTLQTFIMRAHGRKITSAILNASDETMFFDLVASGPSVTGLGDSIAEDIPGDDETERVDEQVPLPPLDDTFWNRIGINPRILSDGERLDLVNGRAIYADAPARGAVVANDDIRAQVAIDRLHYSQIPGLVRLLDGQLSVDNANEIFTRLDQQWTTWRADVAATSGGTFAQHLIANNDANMLNDLTAVRELLIRMRLLGVSEAEYRQAVTAMLGEYDQASFSANELINLVTLLPTGDQITTP